MFKNFLAVVGAITLTVIFAYFMFVQTMRYFDNLEAERQKQVCETLALDPAVELPAFCKKK